MKLENRLFQIWLSLRCPVVDDEVRDLLKNYGSPYELYAADDSEISGLPCSENLKCALRDKDLRQADRILSACQRKDIGVLFWQDKAYPVSFYAIPKPPLLLYYAGRLPDFNRRLCISVVGSRTAGDYAKEAAYQLSYEMAAAGVVVISGMALGVDAVASAGALASGGTTVAVLACGVDIAYPASHSLLREEIMASGAVISEYPPGTRVDRHHFPARNRLISGLSQGTLVVQAAQGSGALITAAHAAEQGRDIFALPGQMRDKASEGTNLLLRDGATFVQDVSDILNKYAVLFADVLDMKALQSARKKSRLDEAFCQSLQVHCKQEMGDVATPSEQPTRPTQTAQPTRSTQPAQSTRLTSPQTKPTTPVVEKKPPSPVPVARPVTSVPVARPETPPPAREGDRSQEILDTLTERQRKMFEVLPLDRALSIDQIVREGFTVPEVLANMTILASKGLVSVLPGSLYIRA